ncbi:MAG: helicase C-terminal domain-containing protein [Lentisphaeria bacterium]|nr:helicase C-terminal domain-containing protein [Lentisphaeria bacterium]
MIKPLEPTEEPFVDAAVIVCDTLVAGMAADEDEVLPGRLLDTVETFFGADTPLKRAVEQGGRPYEERPQQLDMARAIARTLVSGGHLCVEAPTGVGKTFAYLIPAIYYALETGKRAVVSTHTISLQEQLVNKDLPLLKRLTGLDFRYAIAKGRANYVCRRRLEMAAGSAREFLPSADLLPTVEKIRLWTETTRDGTKSDLEEEPEPAVWESVCCEVGNCLGNACDYFNTCFFMKARIRVFSSQVIIANHAVFFIDMAMKEAAEHAAEAGILPDFGMVVLDEGHCVEDTAAENLGVGVNYYALRRLLRRLYNPERARGLLTDSMHTEARLATIRALDQMEAFFGRLYDWVEMQDENPLRYTSPGHIPDLLGDILEDVAAKVYDLAKTEMDDGRKTELLTLCQRTRDYRQAIHTVLQMTEAGYVYWFERFGNAPPGLSLNGVPVDVSGLLKTCLFSQNYSVIVTSATLAVRGELDYFKRRIGAESAESLALTSPFHFAEQVEIHVPTGMPSPKDTRHFVPEAAEKIKHYVALTHGKAFVLFTSYMMMQDMAGELTDFFKEKNIRLLVQGEGMPRTKMLEIFREDVDSVLFGTASFWTGVDVPGEALSSVIITRLPFAVPDHPLVAARQEKIEAEGRNAFYEYSLPEAILRFRQGCGRLIRSRDDKGIIVILDNRVLTTRYGKAFLESLPPCKVHTQ